MKQIHSCSEKVPVDTLANTAIMPFQFEETQFRTMLNIQNGVVYVCLTDLLKAMGSTSKLQDILNEVDKVFGDMGGNNLPIKNNYQIRLDVPDALGRNQETIFVSEYVGTFIVSRGRTERSKKLNRWLFADVIPSILKTGGYQVPSPKLVLTRSDWEASLNWILSETAFSSFTATTFKERTHLSKARARRMLNELMKRGLIERCQKIVVKRSDLIGQMTIEMSRYCLTRRGKLLKANIVSEFANLMSEAGSKMWKQLQLEWNE